MFQWNGEKIEALHLRSGENPKAGTFDRRPLCQIQSKDLVMSSEIMCGSSWFSIEYDQECKARAFRSPGEIGDHIGGRAVVLCVRGTNAISLRLSLQIVLKLGGRV